MIRKTYDGVYFKALDDETGEFEAVVSVFGNVDLQGDRTMPGAFSKSLDNWRATGDPIPVIWSHEWGDPFAHIGYVSPEDAYEVVNEDAKAAGSGIMGGLFVKGHLDVDKPFAKQVYDLLKERRVREWSFAYDVIDEERNAKDHANELNEVALFEVGPTLKGANSATTTLGVKSVLEKAAAEDTAYTRFKSWLDVDPEVAHKLLSDLNEETLMSRLDLEKALAEFKWDGAAAMQSCKSASDFRKIAFERDNDSDPDTAAHWALPHHPSPGAEADPQGVSSALGALSGARGGAPDLKNADAARSHLQAHAGKSESGDVELKENRGDLIDHLELFHGISRDGLLNLSQADLKVIHLGLHSPEEGGGTGKQAPDHTHEEKAEFKPWHVEKQGDEYCCIKDSDGSTVDCHPTAGEAQKHIAALYANAEDTEKWVDVTDYVKEIAPGAEPGSLTIKLDNSTGRFDTYTNGTSTSTSTTVPLVPADKAGRAISKETEERLRRMRDDIDEILSTVAPAEEEKSVEKTAEEVEAEKAKAELEEYKRKLGLLDL